MTYPSAKKFIKVGEIKERWDEFVAPYIEEVDGTKRLKDKNNPPTDYMFAMHCDCSIQTLWNYANKEDYKKFHPECEKIYTEYVALLLNSSLGGNNNANFVLSRKLGFIEINKIKMEEDKESIALLEKYERMSNEEFKKEMAKEIK